MSAPGASKPYEGSCNIATIADSRYQRRCETEPPAPMSDVQEVAAAPQIERVRARHDPAMSPLASMAFSFAVLLEGVTNGDVARSADQQMYSVAAVMLGIAGVSYFLDHGDRKKPVVEVESYGRLGLAEWWASTMTRGAVALVTQVLAVYLAFLLCKRGDQHLAGWFVMAVFAGLAFYGFVAAVLRWFFALRTVNRWIQQRERERYKVGAHTFGESSTSSAD